MEMLHEKNHTLSIVFDNKASNISTKALPGGRYATNLKIRVNGISKQ